MYFKERVKILDDDLNTETFQSFYLEDDVTTKYWQIIEQINNKTILYENGLLFLN
jgi:hypothetical protein